MTKNCETAKKSKTQCSTEPEMFRTEFAAGTRTECLNHAQLSERYGRTTSVILS